MLYIAILVAVLLAVQTVITAIHFFRYQEESNQTSPPAVETVTKTYVTGKVKEVEESVGSALLELVSNLDRLDEDIAAVQNTQVVSEDRLDTIQELSGALLDAINGMDQDIEDLQVRVHSTPSAIEAHRQVVPARPTPAQAQQTRPYVPPVAPTVNTTNEVQVTENTEEPVEVVENVPEVPVEPPVEEVQLKAPRADDEPMITDLRAEPFEEYRDDVGNIHDIPAHSADYEVMGAEKRGGRAATPRGFRRI